jgi:hypothetical protein
VKVWVDTNTTALGALQSNLTTVASGDTGRVIAKEVAADFEGRVKRGFQRGVSPYGERWPKPKKGNPPGRDTETLYKTVAVRAQGSRLLLSAAGVTYAGFFARRATFFPDAASGLPPAWKDATQAIARKHVARKLRGR